MWLKLCQNVWQGKTKWPLEFDFKCDTRAFLYVIFYLSFSWSSVPGRGWTMKWIDDIILDIFLSQWKGFWPSNLFKQDAIRVKVSSPRRHVLIWGRLDWFSGRLWCVLAGRDAMTRKTSLAGALVATGFLTIFGPHPGKKLFSSFQPKTGEF